MADYNLGDWSPSKAAYQSTVLLCADICARYGIEPEYTGDEYGTFTEHRMFAATSCPGDWWHAKMPEFIKDVKEAMRGRYGVPIECIIHPDESGKLFFVSGSSITYIPHPDGVTAIDKVADACGASVPHFELGTKDAPWGFRFFQATGNEELYHEMIR